MKLNWKLWLPQRHKSMLVKFAVAVLLMGLAFRLLLVRSTDISSPVETPFPETQKTVAFEPPASLEAEENEEQIPRTEKCDLFTGDWLPNPSGPIYTNKSCPFIEGHQNCMRNGRPDTGYLYWRWNPRGCDLPRFDSERFLEMMRNKSWALIGDSISRNHVQSLLCMLSTVEKPTEVYHDKEYKSRRWHFPTYNLTISVIFSPFLVKATIFEDYNGVSTSEVQLHLDKLDKQWTNLYQKLDYMIISTGKWFLKSSVYYENNEVVGCHYCPKRKLKELGFDFAYRKALRQVMNFIATSNHKGLILFRTSTPDHFENGEWSSGGTCKRKVPAKEGEVQLKSVHKILHDIELEEFKNVTEKASTNGVNLKLLDVNPLSLLRPDGHPGIYREYHPFARDRNAKVQNDCLHWCLPGPIDSWNDVIMEMVVNS
ncbi:Trichome birefringence-like family [Trema orientale]|uniref:Trichome birefringence-like family n=1 Tax=Trema orientale TaxID=63057 RepID=A0A2P5EA95_TREOI|nr:Trichome birefringence-like family [Trema orientale]